MSSAWFSLQPGQFHRRWNHRWPALPRPGALHPRLPRVAQVSAGCELRSRCGRERHRSWGRTTWVPGRVPCSARRRRSRSCCWDTIGRPPRCGWRTTGPTTPSRTRSGFAHVADLAEIEGNDLNLNISRHVDTTEPVETLSVGEALAQLRKAERSCGSPSAAATRPRPAWTRCWRSWDTSGRI